MSRWKKYRYFVLIAASVLLLSIIATLTKKPSNDRDWLEEFILLNSIEFLENDTVKIQNIRDWQYTNQTISEKNYQERIAHSQNVERVWFVVEPFTGWSAIAHTFFIFDFADQEPLAFSIEARRESHEKFSPLKGLFNEYELYYSWGTETDFLRRRAEYLNHEVYMYPLQITQETAQQLFVELVHETHQLNTEPQFYNTLTSNCTNNLAKHANQVKPVFGIHPALFFTGLSEEYLYQKKLLPQLNHFELARQRHRVDQLIRSASDEVLSQKLRNHLLEE